MAISIFGFQIQRKGDTDSTQSNITSFTPPPSLDGALEVVPFGASGTVIDLDGISKTETDLISRYRDMSSQQECDAAIEDICNEVVVESDDSNLVQIVLDDTPIGEDVKKKIKLEFEQVLKLLHFKSVGYSIFRRWYVDGRLYYHVMIDGKSPKKGIQELRYIDPRKIKKIREVGAPARDAKTGTAIHTQNQTEYYMYSPRGIGSQEKGIKIAPDSICYVHSGILDSKSKFIIGHLQKAIKPLNQLKMLEDASVIYRLTRAPERRLFYIDVGNLPKIKAEQYVHELMVKHKNRITYDVASGEIRDERRFMTMTEDFWLPRREGGRGTEVSTLAGGQNLGEMEDILYFQKKLYKSLNVPVSRLESESQFNLGRSSEITRDELKFSKFVNRLRKRFSMLFDELLKVQLSLKGVVGVEDWEKIKPYIYYDFLKDNHFTELKETEIWQGRLQLLGEMDQYVGKYFSQEWVKKNVLKFSDDDIKENAKQIKDEGKEADDQFNSLDTQPPAPGSPQPPQPSKAPPAPQKEDASEPSELDNLLVEALKRELNDQPVHLGTESGK